MSNIVNLKEISERFNNGTETIEDIMNYCRNYEIQFGSKVTMRVVEKKYFDKLVERIKELEEENLHWRGQYLIALDEIGMIPKQKVKDVLQNNRNELFSTTYIDDKQYKPYTMQIDRINKIENELLEDK